MKKLNYLLAFFVVFGATIVLFSCGDDEPPVVDEAAEKVIKLSKTWSVGSASAVTFAGDPVTSEFSDFKITLSGSKTYTTVSGGGNLTRNAVFKSSGSWDFKDSATSLTQLTFDGDPRTVTATVNNDGTILSLSFTLDNETTLGSGRVMGLDGAWNFSNLTSN